MRLYNTLTKKIEEFEPINSPQVKMYSCGMTVYDYAHIGHGRKYVIDDILRRILSSQGYKVIHVQNVTDVGHLVSDNDEGEDKMEKGARKANKSVWQVSEFFTENFYTSMDKLNILRPHVIAKATDHINDQINLIGKILERGYAYDTPEAVYFDVTKFPGYGKLFGQDLSDKQQAVRQGVETGSHKKNPADFSLWFKRVGRFENHTMHWDSPWGDGFPGWHIECSAMSMKYLGDQFDIHTGGEDHISVHHPNEIAQSEAASGKVPFVKYWVHTAFLLVDGQKMSKSLENFYTIGDVEERGFSPISLRYLYLTVHYKKQQNFTWQALESANNALLKLYEITRELKTPAESERDMLSPEKMKKVDDYREKFFNAAANDLNMPEALAVLWETVKSNIPSPDKLDLLYSFDEILGLKLREITPTQNLAEIPREVGELLDKRNQARKEGRFEESDLIRREIEKLGYTVSDRPEGTVIARK